MKKKASKKIRAKSNTNKKLTKNTVVKHDKVEKADNKILHKNGNVLALCDQAIKEIDDRINKAENALIEDFKAYMAFRKTELELGKCYDTDQFNKRFIENLMDPVLVKNNNFESLKREAREKYSIDFTN